MQNGIELLWQVEEVREAIQHVGACVSFCKFNTSFIDLSFELHMWQDRLEVRLHRSRDCSYQKTTNSIGLAWDIRLINSEGKKWGVEKQIGYCYTLDTGCNSNWTYLASREDLLATQNCLLFLNDIKISVSLRPTTNTLPQPIALYCRSKAGVPRNVLWPVKLFSAMKDGEEKKCTLSKMNKCDPTTDLMLFLEGGSVCIRAQSSVEGVIFVEAVYIMRSDGVKSALWQQRKNIRINDTSQYVAFVSKSMLINNKPLYLHDDTLRICITFAEYCKYVSCIAEEVVEGQIPTMLKLFSSALHQTHDRTAGSLPSSSGVTVQSRSTEDKSVEIRGADEQLQSLADDFSSLLDKESLSDFALKVGPESIQVHKSVLFARSPVFAAMLQSSPSSFEVPGFSSDTVRRFVRFLYSGSVPDLDSSNALELYKLSDKYGALQLRAQCAQVLASDMSIENACRLLSLSAGHSDTGLKSNVLEFIRRHEKQVFRLQEWASLMQENPCLALEVANDIIVKKMEQ